MYLASNCGQNDIREDTSICNSLGNATTVMAMKLLHSIVTPVGEKEPYIKDPPECLCLGRLAAGIYVAQTPNAMSFVKLLYLCCDMYL